MRGTLLELPVPGDESRKDGKVLVMSSSTLSLKSRAVWSAKMRSWRSTVGMSVIVMFRAYVVPGGMGHVLRRAECGFVLSKESAISFS